MTNMISGVLSKNLYFRFVKNITNERLLEYEVIKKRFLTNISFLHNNMYHNKNSYFSLEDFQNNGIDINVYTTTLFSNIA